jgi:hypothetical protein
MGDANKMVAVDGAEIAAIEAIRRRGQREDLAGGESDAATPAWQLTPAFIGHPRLRHDLTIDDQRSGMAADEITCASCDRLD